MLPAPAPALRGGDRRTGTLGPPSSAFFASANDGGRPKEFHPCPHH
ncbi:hypothetical protein HMPREF1979_00552 [Actinomyces johnsonii F0542]|uniref:Uncharacterized protein n=2 Tax=Actinomyces johnsonii TaxID=544581 RepID=U1S426_9ACTO|nr:hypothetical protein HMPREF1549_00836 [Actinomyces johnsonii F0510]ERH25392.1 hypothetical protein HMPREF1979_00552 [Actinomyces johnsonii F0542]